MQKVIVNGEYEIILPKHRAERPEWYDKYGWEKNRTKAIIATAKADDTIFYIGAEEGDIPAIITKYTNADIVLFEPNEIVLPCIKSIWSSNNLKPPIALYRGFVSDSNTDKNIKEDLDNNSFANIQGDVVAAHGFKQLYESGAHIKQVKLDDFCAATSICPTILAIDVEGSEFSVLRGAEQILKTMQVKIFLSVHPVFMWEHYKEETGVMLKYMRDLGYKWYCLEYGIHEHHIVFLKPNT